MSLKIKWFGLLISGLYASPLLATWSIVVFDTESQQAGVASATCISNEQFPGVDLRELLPVVVVGQGAGAAQSLIDGSGQRRSIMRNGILNDTDSASIITQLTSLTNTSQHQHGVVGAGASSGTQTGSANGSHASGVASNVGELYYAIQGNVLAGPEVVTMAEQTLLNTNGDLADRLMAAMETARTFGGDGRCSCPGPNADSCGSPPPPFDKAAHIGFFVLSRFGDIDDTVCNANGCADGDYYLNLNFAAQPAAAEDPILQMRTTFDTQRAGLIGRPDAIQTQVEFVPVTEGYLLNISLFDHQGTALLNSIDNVNIEHAEQSDSNSSIGPIEDNTDGSYSSLLTVADASGDDVFIITVEDAERTIVIPPNHATLNFEAFFQDGFELSAP